MLCTFLAFRPMGFPTKRQRNERFRSLHEKSRSIAWLGAGVAMERDWRLSATFVSDSIPIAIVI
jgi:hypothetical protein